MTAISCLDLVAVVVGLVASGCLVWESWVNCVREMVINVHMLDP